MCVTWHDMKALLEKCNDMNHWTRLLEQSSVFLGLYQLWTPLAIANTGHTPYQTFLPQKSWNIICVALDLISSSTDSRGLTEMKWCEGAPDSHSTLNLVVSLGWWAGQEQQRIDGTAERVSIQVFWQGNVGIKKGNCLLAWYPLCFYEM